jgi:trehalose/maltose transport system permease protein
MASISRKSERGQGLIFLSPLILLIAVFVLFAVLFTIMDSFYLDVTFLPKKFIGFTNYTALFNDPAFRQSIAFTFLFVLISAPLEVFIGFIIALVLNEPFRFRGLLRASILIPWAIPVAVTARIFELIYNYSYGGANTLIELFHLAPGPVNWLGNQSAAFFSLVIADTWKTSPFAAIILLAGLSAIPSDLYAQARVDRAGLGQRFFKITLPLMKPVIAVTFLFRTIQALQVFDFIYVLTKGGPGGTTTSLSMYGYLYFSSGDFGYGSAVSVLLFFMALFFSIGYIRMSTLGKEIA